MTEEEIQERWNANVQAIQDAKARQIRALRTWARVREDAFTQARRRDPRYPVLSAREATRVEEARGELEAAKVGVEEAKVRFKAGDGVVSE